VKKLGSWNAGKHVNFLNLIREDIPELLKIGL